MGVERYLVSEEEVVETFPRISVGRGQEGLSGGYIGYITNQRAIFLKKNKMHEIIFSSLSSMAWEKRRKFGKWMLYLGIILLLAGGLGIILILLWAFLKEEVLVIYGGGKEILVSAATRTTLEDISTTIRNQQALAKKTM